MVADAQLVKDRCLRPKLGFNGTLQVQISSNHIPTKRAPHTAPMSYTAFVDLLQQVPDLAKSLTPRTKKALLSTTRALRRHIQQATTSIKFKPDYDAQAHLQLLVGNQYPQLRHLDLSNAVEYIDLFDCRTSRPSA